VLVGTVKVVVDVLVLLPELIVSVECRVTVWVKPSPELGMLCAEYDTLREGSMPIASLGLAVDDAEILLAPPAISFEDVRVKVVYEVVVRDEVIVVVNVLAPAIELVVLR